MFFVRDRVRQRDKTSGKSSQTNFNDSGMSEHVERILTKVVFRTSNKYSLPSEQ
jgi:hypothetical protein